MPDDHGPLAGVADLDPFIHAPARLRILALLAPARWVTFAYLRETIGTSESALSKQLSALESAGYVESRKDRASSRSTQVNLTDGGRDAFEAYLRTLEQIVARARTSSDPAEESGTTE